MSDRIEELRAAYDDASENLAYANEKYNAAEAAYRAAAAAYRDADTDAAAKAALEAAEKETER